MDHAAESRRQFVTASARRLTDARARRARRRTAAFAPQAASRRQGAADPGRSGVGPDHRRPFASWSPKATPSRRRARRARVRSRPRLACRPRTSACTTTRSVQRGLRRRQARVGRAALIDDDGEVGARPQASRGRRTSSSTRRSRSSTGRILGLPARSAAGASRRPPQRARRRSGRGASAGAVHFCADVRMVIEAARSPPRSSARSRSWSQPWRWSRSAPPPA